MSVMRIYPDELRAALISRAPLISNKFDAGAELEESLAARALAEKGPPGRAMDSLGRAR